MAEYIERTSDINVEGVEFYIKETPDGYVYIDEECTIKASASVLAHAFEMNDIIIVDNDIRHRVLNMYVNNNVVTIKYVDIENSNVVGKEVISYDMTLYADANIDVSEDLFGKVITDLQSNVNIKDNEIIGSLKYITDYTGFSSNPEEQNGNYLAIHCTNNYEAPIFVEIIGGTHGPVQLDSDGIIVLLIRNNEQQIKVTSGDLVKIYSLAELTLEEQE